MKKTTRAERQPNYVAFLRGINVGGHKSVPMPRLKKAFEALRFENVQTLLASGNVLFGGRKANPASLARKIEDKLRKAFHFEIGVIVRTIEKIRNLAAMEPFQGITVTPQTRLYVTFLSEKPKSSLQIPYQSADGNFRILRASSTEVCSVLKLSPDHSTVDLMAVLEKEFGKKVTTRNWNTIARILAQHPKGHK